MKIEIHNCNNIDSARIDISQNKLNIRFAPNGTGKSTIARAIEYGVKGEQNRLNELTPFKYKKSNSDKKIPIVTGIDSLKTIMCFNEDYVNQFTFKPDELLTNSFDIFIKTDEYKQIEQEIEGLILNVKNKFVNNEPLDKLIQDLKDMQKAFILTKTGLSKKSTGISGLQAGNMIQNIPDKLKSYQPFIQSDKPVEWIDWHTTGASFLNLSNICPFCTADTVDKKESITEVGQVYNKNTIKNLRAIIEIIDRLGDFFSTSAQTKLQTIIQLKEGIKKEHEDFLVDVSNQIDSLVKKLEALRLLSEMYFKDGNKVGEILQSLIIDLLFIDKFHSQKTISAINPINESLESMIVESGKLQGKINTLRKKTQDVITKNKGAINEFLRNAGYRYEVTFDAGVQAQLKLRHHDYDEHLQGGKQHLSFGERNAFAIVLFMFECLSKKPDLIILDDPISSFDKNKKYAILHTLFRDNAKKCLKNKTVLMLTHDVESIITTVKSLSRDFENQTTAAFLKLQASVIKELPIQKDDILTFFEICNRTLQSDKDDIIKLIYMRRQFEIVDVKGDAYQVISNLLHKRHNLAYGIDTRKVKDQHDNHPEMEKIAHENGCTEISKLLTNFSYNGILSRICDTTTLKNVYASCTNGYEKLQLCRLIAHKIDHEVIDNFIKQTYHVENEYICQLDPAQFDIIPEYVVEECDKLVVSTS